MNYKLLCIFIGIFILPSVFAVNVTHDQVDLLAPVNFTIGYNDTGTNDTHLFPIACMQEEISIGKCEVERTLSFGETYVKDDDFCDIRFTSQSCNIQDVANITHIVRWSIVGNENNIIIENLNNNDLRSYSRDEKFNFETEFTVQCPAFDERGEPKPLNITDDQFRTYCLEPFGKYGENLGRLNDRYTSSIEGKDETIGSLSASNTNLARDLGSCEVEQNLFAALKTENEETNRLLNTCQAALIAKNQELTGRNITSTLFWVETIALILGIFIYLLYRMTKKHLGDVEK